MKKRTSDSFSYHDSQVLFISEKRRNCCALRQNIPARFFQTASEDIAGGWSAGKEV